jgi:hypothetical protein
MSGMGGGIGRAGVAGLAKLGFGGGHALGGTVMVDRPTLFMAGEGGPEMASFTPMASMASTPPGSSGGSGGVTIGTLSVVTTVQGVKDTDAMARDLGRKIVEQIRGAGQIAFARA